ncbi:hypothetical protein G6514_004386 [Epicoccum nigrum]|nr:hypothetical protein G6514_004386 [Epicoccum nigrum]
MALTTTSYRKFLAKIVYIANDMNMIRNLLRKVPKPPKRSLTNSTDPMSSSTIPGPFLPFDHCYRESLVAWVPSSEYQALPGKHLHAEFRNNSYSDDYTTTLEELELTMLQPNVKVYGMVHKPDSKAVLMELFWYAEDAMQQTATVFDDVDRNGILKKPFLIAGSGYPLQDAPQTQLVCVPILYVKPRRTK